MRYTIVANPTAGKATLDRKRSVLQAAAEILDAEIHGLDTLTSDDFAQCARELAARCDVLVVAGGDGTVSHIINSIDTLQTSIAFLPLGTGNALRYALKYKGNVADCAMRIRDGKIYRYDLINCQEKMRGFIVSVGIDGKIMQLRDQYLARGYTGLKTYIGAFITAFFGKYKRTIGKVSVDNTTFEVDNLLSLIIVKQPYYGFGIKAVPQARFDDGRLHILWVTSSRFKFAIGVATALTIGNRIGHYSTGTKMSVKLDQPLPSQIDGNAAWDADAFTFTVLPKALKIKC